MTGPVPRQRVGGVQVFEHRFLVAAPVEAVAAFHGDPSALRLLTPPPMWVVVHRGGPLAEGLIAEFTLWLGPFPIRWRARHEQVGPTGFVDVQEEGPMRAWRHEHRFVPVEGGTEVVDRIEYVHPPGSVFTRVLFSRLALRGLFFYRALITQRRAPLRSRT